jgi:hypothetical protein
MFAWSWHKELKKIAQELERKKTTWKSQAKATYLKKNEKTIQCLKKIKSKKKKKKKKSVWKIKI